MKLLTGSFFAFLGITVLAAGCADNSLSESAAGTAVGASAAASFDEDEDIDCADIEVGAVTVDTVVVPDGASCVLRGTRLIGSIKVGTDATLAAYDVRVNGDVQAEGSTDILLAGASTVGGSVQIKEGDSASITGAQINGDLQFDELSGAIEAFDNTIGGNLQAFQNDGGVELFDNLIDGNLQCKENRPAPVGSGNRAASKEDQCAAL